MRRADLIQRRTAHARGKTAPQAGALADLAARSPRVAALTALQRVAEARAPLQREVDTSPSPALPEYDAGERPGWARESGVAGWAAKEFRGEGVDRSSSTALPDYAENERPGWAREGGVPDWAAKEYRGEGVDRSTSPALPEYDEGEMPAWAREKGLPKWVKDDFIAPTLVASMTPDGRIGSVYFDDGNRIRTTHGSGPEKSDHTGKTTKKFNLSRSGAEAAFEASAAFKALDAAYDLDMAAAKKLPTKADRATAIKLATRKGQKAYAVAKKRFLKETLRDATPATMPAWATPADSPEMAIDTDTDGLPGADTQLFEIFLKSDGSLAGSHPSRGAGVKLETDSLTVKVLREAVALVARTYTADIRAMKGKAKRREAYRRNRAFYDYVVARAPEFAARLRTPEEVRDG